MNVTRLMVSPRHPLFQLITCIVVLVGTSYSAAAQVVEPTLKVSPADGVIPAAATATGTGFTGFGPVTFTVDEIDAGEAKPDAAGGFVFELTIEAAPGPVLIRACQADADGAPCALTATATFVVNTPPTTTVPPTTTTLPPTTTLLPTTTTAVASTTTTSTVVGVGPIGPGTTVTTAETSPAGPGDIDAAAVPPANTESVIPELAGIVVLCVIVGGAAYWMGTRRKTPPAASGGPGSHVPPSQTKVKLLAPDAGPEEGFISRGMEAGEQGGTEDINIGVGELQETNVDPEGKVKPKFPWDREPPSSEAEARGWDPVEKEKVEGKSTPPAQAPGTELDDIGAPQAEATSPGERVMKPEYGSGLDEAPGTDQTDIGSA